MSENDSMKERCGNCKFFLLAQEGDELGDCRRFPPSIPYKGEKGRENAVFPIVFNFFWCGEWQAIGSTRATHAPHTDAVAIVGHLDRDAIIERLEAIDAERKALLTLMRAANAKRRS